MPGCIDGKHVPTSPVIAPVVIVSSTRPADRNRKTAASAGRARALSHGTNALNVSRVTGHTRDAPSSPTSSAAKLASDSVAAPTRRTDAFHAFAKSAPPSAPFMNSSCVAGGQV